MAAQLLPNHHTGAQVVREHKLAIDAAKHVGGNAGELIPHEISLGARADETDWGCIANRVHQAQLNNKTGE